MNKKRFPRKPRKCPSCSSRRVGSILYGMPAYDEKMERDINEGRIVPGGCCPPIDGPNWECADCHMQFYKEYLL